MSRTKGKAQEKYRVLVAPQGVGKSTALAIQTLGRAEREFLPYAEAKALVTKSGVKTIEQFHKWQRPAAFPANPTAVYKYSGWQSWSEFLSPAPTPTKKIFTLELNHAELSLLCVLLKADVMNGGQGYVSWQESGDSETSSDELLYKLEPTEDVQRLIAEFVPNGKFQYKANRTRLADRKAASKMCESWNDVFKDAVTAKAEGKIS